jgi:hypothetical protein
MWRLGETGVQMFDFKEEKDYYIRVTKVWSLTWSEKAF